MEWLGIAAKYAGYISTLIALAVVVLPKTRSLIVKWFKEATGMNSLKKIIDDQAQKDAELEERANKRDVVIAEIHTALMKHIEDSNAHDEQARERDLYFLRTQINNIYLKYIPLGYITVRAKSDLLKAYELYEQIGGNSYAKSEVEELKNLQTRF